MGQLEYSRILLKLSGEALLGSEDYGIDPVVLKRIAMEIRKIQGLGVEIGLVIGGALANALDRVVHSAVADFFLLHAYGYSWYIFNLADVAIVAGVALLLYESWGEDNSDDTRGEQAP